MKEQEAIETLQDIHDVAKCRIKNGDSRGVVYIPEEKIAAFEVAIDALEEILQYRTIGTPDECQEAVERNQSKQVTSIMGDKLRFGTCPCCGRRISTVEGGNYCQNCGQRLEW